VRSLRKAWQGILSRFPAWGGLAVVWLSSAWIALNPEKALLPAGILFLSAWLLSGLAPRKARIFKAAVLFLGFWSLAWLLLRGPAAQGGFRPETLAACLFLGLHLFLVWTPASLGSAVASVSRPFAGERRARLLGLTLAALAKAVPDVLSDAAMARRSLARVGFLGIQKRMALWGRSVTRLTLKRTQGLGRTLAKRQADLG
jgi:hypothetical protein